MTEEQKPYVDGQGNEMTWDEIQRNIANPVNLDNVINVMPQGNLPSGNATVSQSNSIGGNFNSVEDAVNFALTKTTSSTRPVQINVSGGTFDSDTTLTKGYISVIGKGSQHTVLTVA